MAGHGITIQFASATKSQNIEKEKNLNESDLGFGGMRNNYTIRSQKQLKSNISKIGNREKENEPCDSTALNCMWDPRGFIFESDDIVKTGKVYYGKYQPDTTITDFYDVAYAADNASPLTDDYNTEDDILPACPTAYSCSQIGNSLYYYVYYPKHDYTSCPLPVVILFHAGGFSDCSQLNYENDLCVMLARKGFIVVNVEYRRGRIKDLDLNGKYTSVQQVMANLKAFQDGRGAVRTVILDQRNIALNHLPYKIDTSEIFIAGQSAGGMIATNICFFTSQAQLDAVFPSPTGLAKISNALGPLDADFYRGTPDIDFHSKIKALWCMWGAIPIPIQVSNASDEYNFLTRNDTVPLIPTISFLGAKDAVFSPIKSKQFVYYPIPPPTTYTIETGCMINSPFELSSSNSTKKQFRLECTNDLYKILKDNGVPTLVYLDCDMKHGLENPKDKSDPISTNFNITSISVTTLAVVNNYMASRFTVFARALYIGNAGTLAGTSKFSDCEDYRHTCTTDAENAGCTAQQHCTPSSDEQ
ncbi:MAG: alpha/beta hydrolase [Chitinophagaceae bacterium]